jgi:hypothetical protein
MQQENPTFEDVLKLVERLSSDDKRRLFQHIASDVTREEPTERRPRKSMRGILADLGPAPSSEDIDEARREAWKNFPREDI